MQMGRGGGVTNYLLVTINFAAWDIWSLQAQRLCIVIFKWPKSSCSGAQKSFNLNAFYRWWGTPVTKMYAHDFQK